MSFPEQDATRPTDLWTHERENGVGERGSRESKQHNESRVTSALHQFEQRESAARRSSLGKVNELDEPSALNFDMVEHSRLSVAMHTDKLYAEGSMMRSKALEIFHLVDENSDGKLSEEEFVAMYKLLVKHAKEEHQHELRLSHNLQTHVRWAVHVTDEGASFGMKPR